MKFKAERATLLKALAHIQSVAEKRNTIPILANALIVAKRGTLSFTATDMEIAIVEESSVYFARSAALQDSRMGADSVCRRGVHEHDCRRPGTRFLGDLAYRMDGL